MATISLIALLISLLPLMYLLLLALASIRFVSPIRAIEFPSTRFTAVIPAHDEASVIGTTIQQLRALDYPADLFSVYVDCETCLNNAINMAMATTSLLVLLVSLLPLAYLLLLALASVYLASPPIRIRERPSTRFTIAIPAHDEASVIGATVRRLCALDYPAELFSVHVVADHCSDHTAALARQAGALVHERNEGPRNGKGAALMWLFQSILDNSCDAVVIFDADTQVDPCFLCIMDAHLARGAQVIQGQHIIRNPESGWFPALTWAMFLVDNRFQNLGRSNLGWSAKHMGDSICFRAEVLRKIGWGEGLTEDYQLRQRLLLEGIRITY